MEFDPAKLVYERNTQRIAALIEQIMTYLNEIDVENERKIVEFALGSTQGEANVTIQWTPICGKTAGELMGDPWHCICHYNNRPEDAVCFQCKKLKPSILI